MKSIQFSETGNSLKVVLDQVQQDGDVLAIAGDDGSIVVMLTLAEYSGLVETAHLLSSPANAAHLAKSIAQYQTGDVVERDVAELIELGSDDAQPPILK